MATQKTTQTYRLGANDDDSLRLVGDDQSEIDGMTVVDALARVASLRAAGHTVKVRPSAQRVLDGGEATR